MMSFGFSRPLTASIWVLIKSYQIRDRELIISISTSYLWPQLDSFTGGTTQCPQWIESLRVSWYSKPCIIAKSKDYNIKDQRLLISKARWTTPQAFPQIMLKYTKPFPVFHSVFHQLSLRGGEAALLWSDGTRQVPKVSQISLSPLPGSW